MRGGQDCPPRKVHRCRDDGAVRQDPSKMPPCRNRKRRNDAAAQWFNTTTLRSARRPSEAAANAVYACSWWPGKATRRTKRRS